VATTINNDKKHICQASEPVIHLSLKVVFSIFFKSSTQKSPCDTADSGTNAYAGHYSNLSCCVDTGRGEGHEQPLIPTVGLVSMSQDSDGPGNISTGFWMFLPTILEKDIPCYVNDFRSSIFGFLCHGTIADPKGKTAAS